jgi:O-antigen ligase
MWIGATTHKNVLGEVCMISGIFFVWSILRHSGKRRFVDFGFLLIALWLLGGSESYTSITAILTFLVGVGLVCFLGIGKSRVEYLKRYLVAASIVLVIGLLGIGFAVETFSGKSVFATGLKASGRDTTLTGRTELWEDMLNVASKHPIGGVGYGSFWIGNLGNDLWERHIWRPTQGHNGYLDVYVELGIAGVCFLMLVVISSFRQITRTFESHFEYGRFRFTILVVLLLHNITESSFERSQ